MIYEIHLYSPKAGKLTPAMLEWLYQHGQSDDQPEPFWPVNQINPKALARLLLKLDSNLIPQPGPAGDVELHYSQKELNIILYIHNRGVILFFPYMPYGAFARITVGICYTYIRYLYDTLGFWSYDPQLDILSYADDFQSMDDTIRLMDKVMSRYLTG